jgi:hypothetical protein
MFWFRGYNIQELLLTHGELLGSGCGLGDLYNFGVNGENSGRGEVSISTSEIHASDKFARL